MLKIFKFSLFFYSFLAVLLFPKNIEAASLDFSISEIDNQGSVTQEYLDEDDLYNKITIQKELDSFLRIKNNVYTVKHTSNGFYTASFKINVSENKIIKAHSSNVSLYTGNLSNTILSIQSANQAKLSFNQKILLATLKRNITATVNNDKISINVN